MEKKYDIFIAYHGNAETGSQQEAEALYKVIHNYNLNSGRKINAYFHPVTNPNGYFEETPRIVARTPLLLLVVNKRIPKNEMGQLAEFAQDGTRKNLYDEVKAFRTNPYFKKSHDSCLAKIFICDDMEFKDAEKLDPMFSGTTAFRKTDSNVINSIISWIEEYIISDEKHNDWRDNKLKESVLYKELMLRDDAQYYCDNIVSIYSVCEKELNNIQLCYLDNIAHDINHTYSVLQTISDLLGSEVSKLTTIEIVTFILSAVLHDIGLSFDCDEEQEIIANDGYSDIELKLSNIQNNIFDGDQSLALQYIINCSRDYHIKNVIERLSLVSAFQGKHNNYLNDILQICKIHSGRIEEIAKNYLHNKIVDGQALDQRFLIAVLHLADILNYDFSGLENERNIFALQLELNNEIENIPDLIISNVGKKVRKSTQSRNRNCLQCSLSSNEIFIQSVSYDELKHMCSESITSENYDTIQCRILEYKEYIQRELQSCKRLLFNGGAIRDNWGAESRFSFNIEDTVVYIGGDEDRVPNHKIDIDYATTVSLLLGEQIYGNKRVGLREIIQNSMDACKYRQIRGKSNFYSPTIKIILSKTENQIRITDNGIGMNRYILENYFLKIGKSLYSSEVYKESNYQFKHAGHFGIGFFASFMLSDHVEIFTRYINEGDGWNIRVNTNGRYASISKIPGIEIGTTIILKYDEFEKNFNVYNLENFDLYTEIKNYVMGNFLADISPNTKIKVFICDTNGNGEEEILIESLQQIVGKSQDETVDLSQFLEDVECKIRIENQESYDWYSYSRTFDIEKFEKIDSKYFFGLKDIVYKKIYYKGRSIYLFVPEKYWEIDEVTKEKIKPFNYDGIDRQSAFVSKSETIFGNITISQLFKELCWEFPDLSKPIMAFVGKLYVLSTNQDIIFYQKNINIEQREPNETATLNGIESLDNVYVRNVCIPSFHIELPVLLHRINDSMIPLIKKMIINIEKAGVYPNIDRNDMPAEIKKEISDAVGMAILLWIYSKFKEKAIISVILSKLNAMGQNRFFKKLNFVYDEGANNV